MRKIIIAMTAAWAGAYIAQAAEGTISCTSFEGLTAGDPLNISFDDNGGTTNSKFWSVEGYVSGESALPEVGVISNHVVGVEILSRPEEYATGTNEKYLAVDTEKKLFRNINADGSATAIAETGMFVDSLVQFTATETAPTPDSADKLIVWLQAIDADEATGVEGSTNLVITAGYIDESAAEVVSHNYVIPSSDLAIEPNTWHRLTIKAIADIGNQSGYAGFAVYVDEKAISSTDSKGALPTLNEAASALNGKNQLFPSLIQQEADNFNKLSSLAVEGTGAIDDIVFTTKAPSFAQDVVVGKFTLALTYPTTVTELYIGEEEYEGATEFEVGTESVTISAVVAEGYKVVNAGAELNDGYWQFDVDVSAAQNGQTITVEIEVDEASAPEKTTITASMITLSATEAELAENLQLPTVTVKDGEKVLAAFTDYELVWTPAVTGAITKEGDYTVTVTGIGSYKGQATATFKVTKAQEAGKAKIGDQEYENGADFVKDATSATSNKLPADWTVVNNVIKDAEGNDFATLPAFYTATLAADGTLTLALNDNAKTTVAIDTTAETPLAVAEGVALAVTVTNEKLYYALASSTSLTGTYEAPAAGKYVKGNGGKLTLTADKSGATCFYKIVVTDVVPTTAE